MARKAKPATTKPNGANVRFEKKLWEAGAEPFEEKMKRLTATLREQPAEAAKLDAAIEPFGSRIQTWPLFPTTLAP